MNKVNKIIKNFRLNVQKIIAVPESYSSEVYCLILANNEKVILKIPYSQRKLFRELEMLELLEDKLPVPKVLDFWEGDEETPGAFLLTYIQGEPITELVDLKLAGQMGELLARLHQIPMKSYNLVQNESDWWKSIHTTFLNWIPECKQVMSSNLLSNCIKVFEQFYQNLPEPDGPRVVHLDYRPGNILVNNSKIAGLIDFESARGGSADLDFTKPKIYVWDKYPKTKEEFIKAYESIRPLPDIAKTLPFYLFYNAFGGIAWCVKRKQLEGDFFKENLEQLKQTLSNFRVDD